MIRPDLYAELVKLSNDENLNLTKDEELKVILFSIHQQIAKLLKIATDIKNDRKD